jgi:hypothetical protein
MKTCKLCKNNFPANNEYFYKNVSKGKAYLDSYCKKCKTAKKVEWQRNNKDKVNASAATYRTKNRDIMNKKMNDYYYQNK